MDVRIIMAEFCLACWNKLNKRNEPAERYVLSKDLDLCEGCGEWKNVIVRERKSVLWKSNSVNEYTDSGATDTASSPL